MPAARCCATSSPSGASSIASAERPPHPHNPMFRTSPKFPLERRSKLSHDHHHHHDHAAGPASLTLFTPAGVLPTAAPLRRAAKRLAALGFEVHVDEAALAKHQRFGGDDDTR